MTAEYLSPARECDVLVVGAGPTGLALAAALHAGGASVRIIDQNVDRTGESRALAVQPRSLEVLRSFGLADELVRRGNPAVQLRIHFGRRVVPVPLFDIGLDDTAFGFLLFVSQAETEAVLGDHLAAAGVRVERGVRFERCSDGGDRVVATLRTLDGGQQEVSARYLVGCDGAHSTVRDHAGIPFLGGGYPQIFLLADLDVEGLEPGTVHTYLTDTGPLFFFPLAHPAPWRVITMRPQTGQAEAAEESLVSTPPVSLAELQELADGATGGTLRLHDRVWATASRLHHRHAARYRAGRMFLAGDAAHIHSPAGAQGMNTGLQDAANLGWKLALVCRGAAPEALLDSYDAERRPVGAFVLRFTDRAFTAATSTSPLVRAIRTHLAPRLIPAALHLSPGRAAAFRTVSQLGIRYRTSPAVAPSRRPLRGPRPVDRLPDAPITRDGKQTWLHEALTGLAFHLLLCGPVELWNSTAVEALQAPYGALLTVHRLDRRPGPGALHDHTGRAFARLRVAEATRLVVRPDGHIGYRANNDTLEGARRYLAQWLAGRR